MGYSFDTQSDRRQHFRPFFTSFISNVHLSPNVYATTVSWEQKLSGEREGGRAGSRRRIESSFTSLGNDCLCFDESFSYLKMAKLGSDHERSEFIGGCRRHHLQICTMLDEALDTFLRQTLGVNIRDHG